MIVNIAPERINIKGYKNNDCTVNAIGNSLGVSYDLSRKILQTLYVKDDNVFFRKSNPRRKDQFVRQNIVEMICEAISSNVNNYEDRKEYMSVRDFAKENPNGRYIILVRRHLLAVVDGKILDTENSSRSKIKISYEINQDEAIERISCLSKYYRMNTSRHIKYNNSLR